jgi:hypothetical protein
LKTVYGNISHLVILTLTMPFQTPAEQCYALAV